MNEKRCRNKRFSDKLNEAIRQREEKDFQHYSDAEWAEAFGISQSTLTDYRNAVSTPRVDKLSSMAHYLNMDIRELTGAHDEPFEGATFQDFQRDEMERLQRERYGEEICAIVGMLEKMKPEALHSLRKEIEAEYQKPNSTIFKKSNRIPLPPIQKIKQDGLESRMRRLQPDGTYR